MSAGALEPPARHPANVAPAGVVARAIALPAGLAAVLFVLAFAARLIGVGLFVTPDEDNWMGRAASFSRALSRGQFQLTYQSGHPGVTTMWVASLGMGREAGKLRGARTADPATIVTRHPDWDRLFIRARYAMIAANAALIAVIGLLAWRLLGPGPALLGGVLMALDPFLVAHGQVVHVDALATGLMTVAVLAGGIFWLAGGGWGYLALCAAAGGLGVLTKAPAFFLGVFLPLVAIAAAVLDRRAWSPGRLALSVLACGFGALVVVVLGWPALWVAPVETATRIVEYQILQSATPHGPGNYFLGVPTPDPGYRYYPVAVMFRLAPVVMAGLVALLVVLPSPARRRQVSLLAGFTFGFLVFVTLASKKLDRYALPLFPSLALLAGLGIWMAYEELAGRIARVGRHAQRWLLAGFVGVAAAGQALALASVAPYPLAFYNPLVGGGPAAERVMLVGWGEGLDRVAAYLNAQPNAAAARIAIYYPLVLNFQGMVAGTLHRFTDSVPTDYVVDYVNAAQRGQTPPEVYGLRPDFIVELNGIVYARVFRLDPPRLLSTAEVAPSE
ncbi:MAG: hypothetical protein M3O34_07135 [Chloroflexota bacterium]|nr:hypothetical protein [Chloroflexota bacterium]